MNQIPILPAILGYAAGGATLGLWLAVIVVALLSGCSSVQRFEAYPSTAGGFFVRDCLYDKSDVNFTAPKSCRLVCTSQTRVSPDALKNGKCQ